MVDEFGVFEYGESMKSRVVQYYVTCHNQIRVNPLFNIIVDAFGGIGVSHYTFYNTNVFLCRCLVSECVKCPKYRLTYQ